MIFLILLCCFLKLYPSKIYGYVVDANPPFASAVLVEAETGKVLFSYKPNVQRSPASTQKMLLSKVAMDLLKEKEFS